MLKIPLRNKKHETIGYALCSPEDYQKLNQHKWHKAVRGGYPQARIEGRTVTMHKFLTNPPKGLVTDHINRNVLDNRRQNLRVVTRKRNTQNRTKKKNAKSKYYGVFTTENGKYRAVITRTRLGVFQKEEDAALAYDAYLAHHPDYAQPMNWPHRRKELAAGPLIYPKAKKIPTSEYIGVTKRRDGRCLAQISVNRQVTHIGSYKNELDAANAYDVYVVSKKLDRELNFPEKYQFHAPPQEIKTTMTAVDAKTCRLNLPNGLFTNIDTEDYEKVQHYVCYEGDGYVKIILDDGNQRLHRYLMGAKEEDPLVDHIDKNPLNNCKSNLRFSTNEKNAQNKTKAANKSSQYLGVYAHRKSWRCRIMGGGKKLMEKGFNDEENAARWRDLYILNALPETHYSLNFKWTEEETQEWKKKLAFDRRMALEK